MVPFVESCPLFRPAILLFAVPPLAEPLLLLLLLLHSVSGWRSATGVLDGVAEDGTVGGAADETKSKKSPLVMSSGRNGSPMSMAEDDEDDDVSEEATVTGEVATTTLVAAAITVPVLDDITTHQPEVPTAKRFSIKRWT